MTFYFFLTLSLAAKAQLCSAVFPAKFSTGLSVVKKATAIHEKVGSHLYGRVVEVGGDSRTADYLKNAKGGLAQTLVDSYVPHDKIINETMYPTNRAADPRFIKESKVEKMLSVEMDDLLKNEALVKKVSAEKKRFFVFANTAETHHDKRGQAWFGLRIQFEDGFYDFHLQVTLHREASAQQWDLGKLGINLIYGVMEHVTSPSDPVSQQKLVESLFDNIQNADKLIKLNAIKISKVGADGRLEKNLVDPVRMSKILFEIGVARTLFIQPSGDFVDPATLLYEKSIQFFEINSTDDAAAAFKKSALHPERIATAVIPIQQATPDLISAVQQAGMTIILQKEKIPAETLVQQKQDYLNLLKAKVYGPNE